MNTGSDKIFKAVADQTRRDIIALLQSSPDTLSIKDIASQFNISRQGITKHLDILEEANLVKTRVQGRDRLCYVDLRPLKHIDQWIENYRVFWRHKLDDLGDYLDGKK